MKFRIFVFKLSLLAFSPAHAADFSGCEVVEIVLAGDKNAHVALNCVVSNSPVCAVASNYVGFDKSTSAGKQYLALFLFAQATGAKVEGWVDSQICSPWQGNVALLQHLRAKK